MPMSKQLDKLIADGDVVYGGDPSLVVRWVSTGIPQLDAVMGGGMPLEKFSLIYGTWSAGKTLLAQMIAAEFQRQGHTVAYMDTEASYDPEWWSTLGVDTDALLVSPQSSGEKGVDVLQALVGAVGLVIVDSLAGLVPLADYEQSAEDATMAQHPRLINRLFRMVVPKMRRSGTAVLFTNQTRVSFGPGMQDALPGGRAQQFYSHVQLRVSRAQWIKSGDDRTGYHLRVECPKNKLARPLREVTLPFILDGYFDFVSVLLADAIDRGIIDRTGPWYRIPAGLLEHEHEALKPVADSDEVQVMGRGALREVFMSDEAARERLEELTYRPKGLADGPAA